MLNVHPLKHNLALLKKLIEQAPFNFDQNRKEEMIRVHEEFHNNLEVKIEEVEDKMIEFGKEIWPYHESYMVFFRRLRQEKREQYFLDNLTEESRQKYLEYKKQGGGLEQLIKDKNIAKMLSAEEKFKLDQAVVNTFEKLKEETSKVISENKKEEYFQSIGKYKEERDNIILQINELKNLAQKYSDDKDEILKSARAFELGFSNLTGDPEFDLREVREKIEYFVDKNS